MLIWLIIFIVILAVSFVLAIQSMVDYEQRPKHFNTPYSLFLISKENNLTSDLLSQLYQSLKDKGFIFSLERLFKGNKKALVVYGPTSVIKPFSEPLGLLELEDYSLKANTADKPVLAWEIGQKPGVSENLNLNGISSAAFDLKEDEDLWWQLVLQPQTLKVLIRVVVLAQDNIRAAAIKTQILDYVKDYGLAMVPQTYSTEQMVNLYQERSLPLKGVFLLNLSPEEIRKLLLHQSPLENPQLPYHPETPQSDQ